MQRHRYLKYSLGVATLFILLIGLRPVGASSANISHSYSSSGQISTGSLVSLDAGKSNFVVAANSDNGQQLLGIAVASNDSLLAVDPSNSSGTVQVATSGTANALVSDVNGPISVGDQISVSPFGGVGMRAAPGSHVIGLAQTSFSSSTSGASTKQVTDRHGKSSTIHVGFIKLGIAVGTASTQGNDYNLNQIQKFVKSLTGRQVSTIRALVTLAVAIITMIVMVTLIYSAIYGGIVSIGRNPLAKYAVFRSITSVFFMVVFVAAIAAMTIYFLLK